MANNLKKVKSTDYTAEEIYTTYINIVLPRIQDIEIMFYEGKTFSEIANELGVSNSLLWAMRTSKSCVELRDAFKGNKLMAENVEMALYRKATGYFIEKEVPMKMKREYVNKMERKCTKEEIQMVKVKEYIPPDFNAQRFYLLNHCGDRYHPENAKPIDDSVDRLVESAKNVLISIKKVANDESDE